MLKKLFIIPWAGDFPSWMPDYLENIANLKRYGYDLFITQDMEDFSSRVQRVLGFTPTIHPGTPLLHNYRTAFGLIYEEMLKEYDFWGITDLDCVYGKVDNFITDEQLKDLDIHSNHVDYICGPWTLFRNTEKINNLFRKVPNWEGLMQSLTLQPGRWTEVEYSKVVDEEHEKGNINRLYTHYQGIDPNDDSAITFDGERLYDHGQEIMMWHGNRNKRWPI